MAIKYIIVLFVETPRKFITAKLSIRKPGSSSVLIICPDEDPGLRIESFAVINLRGVSTNKTIIYLGKSLKITSLFPQNLCVQRHPFFVLWASQDAWTPFWLKACSPQNPAMLPETQVVVSIPSFLIVGTTYTGTDSSRLYHRRNPVTIAVFTLRD
jgi:hypothetical protein